MTASVVDGIRELVVDESGPFAPGRPLDRGPGVPLFGGLLDLAVRADRARSGRTCPGRVVAGLDFTGPREPGGATTLSCRPVRGPNRAWTVTARRAGEEVCAGSIAFADDGPAVPADPRPVSAPPPARPAAAESVHRPGTVLVGEPVRRGRSVVEAAVLEAPVPETPEGTGPASPVRDPAEIVEAGWQFAVLMAHEVHGTPADVPVLCTTLRLDIPYRVARDVPLLLRWTVARVPGSRPRCAARLADASTGAVLGTLTYEAYALDPEPRARTA